MKRLKAWLLKWLLGDKIVSTNVIRGPKDIVVVYLDSGMMPIGRAKTYENRIHDQLKTVFKDNKVIIMPHSSSIDIINFKEKDK